MHPRPRSTCELCDPSVPHGGRWNPNPLPPFFRHRLLFLLCPSPRELFPYSQHLCCDTERRPLPSHSHPLLSFFASRHQPSVKKSFACLTCLKKNGSRPRSASARPHRGGEGERWGGAKKGALHDRLLLVCDATHGEERGFRKLNHPWRNTTHNTHTSTHQQNNTVEQKKKKITTEQHTPIFRDPTFSFFGDPTFEKKNPFALSK